MPYPKNSNLPDNVKGVLPAGAQTIFREAFNSALNTYNDDEEKARKVAWAAVKKVYKKEGDKWVKKSNEAMQTNEENVLETEEQSEEIVEYSYVPFDIVSFGAYEARQKAREKAYRIKELTEIYQQLVDNIAYSRDIVDKQAAMRVVFDEYIQRLGDVTSSEAKVEEDNKVELHENIKFLNLQESVQPGTYLEAEVQIIKPGWGNTRDNHYYPEEVLRRDAYKFINAKMYETDHNQQDKSTKTWVSTIYDIPRFTEEGAPVALVRIHNMDFAQRLKNLEAENLLDRMECSILASALGEPNFELDGREGHKITEFTQVHDVDWVTKAGAGGKVLALKENSSIKENDMSSKEDLEQKEHDKDIEESAKKIPVIVHESDQPQPAEGDEQQNPEEAEETFLSDKDVNEYLMLCGLPDISKKRLAVEKYHTTQELTAAVTNEAEYVKELVGSGEVQGLGDNTTLKSPLSVFEMSIEDLQQQQQAVESGYDKIVEKM